MKVLIELDLEEYDSPTYMSRVAHAMQGLLDDLDFVYGSFDSGRQWFFHMPHAGDQCMTRATVVYSTIDL